MEITINVPDGKKVEWKKIEGVGTVPTLVDIMPEEGKSANRLFDKSIPITERIKTFEDAMAYTGMTFPIDERTMSYLGADVVAYMKLRVIAAALNELSETTLGEFPKFTKGEYRYYPWFDFYTKEQYEKMDEEQRKEVLWLWGGNSHSGARCGLVFSTSNDAWTYSYSSISARLAVKNRDLAIYFGRQFCDIWADYVFRAVEHEKLAAKSGGRGINASGKDGAKQQD